MILLSQLTVAIGVHLSVALVAVEDILVLACEAQVALVADQGTHVVFVNAVLLGHDVQTYTDSLPDHLNVRSAFLTCVHLPRRLLISSYRHGLLLGEGFCLHISFRLVPIGCLRWQLLDHHVLAIV